MARLPSISARATPRKKATSSSSSSPKTTSGPSKVSDSRIADQQVSKAAKRAARRAQLLRHDEDDSTSQRSHSSSTPLGLTPTISKSALRRRKRKIRDQAVLGHQGLDQIKDELAGLEDDEEGDEWEEADVDAQLQGIPGSNELTAAQRKAEANQAAGNARVGAKMRKKVLAQESLRQPHILKDLQSTTQSSSTPGLSPFAMLRQHAQNSLGLNAPVVAKNKAKHDGDVQMQ